MSSLSVSAILSFVKGNATFYSDPTAIQSRLPGTSITVDGKNAIEGTELITTSDEVLPLGDIGTIGYIFLRNLSPALVSTPDTPVITNVVLPTPHVIGVANIGAAGAITVSYKVQAVMGNGDLSPASATATTATSNDTLDGTNYNKISWDPIEAAASYNIYRTVSPSSPSTTGLIGNTTDLFINDTGLSGDGTSAATFTDAATWTYEIVARGPDDNNSYTVASGDGSTTSGREVTGPNNYNHLQWVPIEGATSYDIYRTVAGTTPSTLGLIANVAGSNTLVDPVDGLTYAFADDKGLIGDGTTAPSASPWDFGLIVGPDGSSYPLALKGQDPLVGRWAASAIHVKATVNPALLYYLIVEA